ncbi:hypothetical protein F8R89_12430 [Streptomyces sp. SS1-1]|uniref:hypothetical protein n=1 Tax=Streptomyces sp. SS1-1 TaxID=2651869 RepID=UPI00124FCC62|nr:hypothetical protein [Streptomyces sp. SS1-1]KAB2972768.1 hypothetical protein F8R89_12430 [Streptomyces sp. SS1-1]
METPWEYRAVLAVDIEKSSGRGNTALMENRRTLRRLLETAFERGGVDWQACARHDLGDGLRVTAPAGTRKAALVHPLVDELAGLLRAHNAEDRDAATRLRVRMALHAGEVGLTADGDVVGAPLETLARLLDAPPLRAALERAPRTVPVALLMSRHFYDDTVRHGYEGIDPDTFHEVGFTVKELTADAWLHTPGWTPPRKPGRTGRGKSGRKARDRDRAVPGPTTMNNRASGNGVVNAAQNGDLHVRITRHA